MKIVNVLSNLFGASKKDNQGGSQILIQNGQGGTKSLVTNQNAGQSLRIQTNEPYGSGRAQNPNSNSLGQDVTALSISELKALNYDNLKLFVDDFVELNRVDLEEIKKSFGELEKHLAEQEAIRSVQLKSFTQEAGVIDGMSAINKQPSAFFQPQITDELLAEAQQSHLQDVADTIGRFLQRELENIVKVQGLSQDELTTLAKDTISYAMQTIGLADKTDEHFEPDVSTLVEATFTDVSASIAEKEQTNLEHYGMPGEALNADESALEDRANDGGAAMEAFSILASNFVLQGKANTPTFMQAIESFQRDYEEGFDVHDPEQMLMLMFELSQNQESKLFDAKEKQLIENAARSLVQFVDEGNMLSLTDQEIAAQGVAKASNGQASIFDSLVSENAATQEIFNQHFKDRSTLNNSMFDHFMTMDRIDLHSLLNDQAAYSELFFAEKLQGHLDMSLEKSQHGTSLALQSSQSEQTRSLENISKAETFEWPLPEKPGFTKIDKSWISGNAEDYAFVTKREAENIELLRDTMKYTDAQNQMESIKLWERIDPGIVERVKSSLKEHEVSNKATDREFLFFNRLYRQTDAITDQDQLDAINDMRQALERLGVELSLSEYVNSNGEDISGADFEMIKPNDGESQIEMLNKFKDTAPLTTSVDIVVSNIMDLELTSVTENDPLEAVLETALAKMSGDIIAELSINFDKQTKQSDKRLAQFQQHQPGSEFLSQLSNYNRKIDALLENTMGLDDTDVGYGIRKQMTEAINGVINLVTTKGNEFKGAYTQAYIYRRLSN